MHEMLLNTYAFITNEFWHYLQILFVVYINMSISSKMNLSLLNKNDSIHKHDKGYWRLYKYLTLFRLHECCYNFEAVKGLCTGKFCSSNFNRFQTLTYTYIINAKDNVWEINKFPMNLGKRNMLTSKSVFLANTPSMFDIIV